MLFCDFWRGAPSFLTCRAGVRSNLVFIYRLSRTFEDPFILFNSNLYQRPRSLNQFGKNISGFYRSLLPEIVFDGIHQYFKYVFLIIRFVLNIFRAFVSQI